CCPAAFARGSPPSRASRPDRWLAGIRLIPPQRRQAACPRPSPQPRNSARWTREEAAALPASEGGRPDGGVIYIGGVRARNPSPIRTLFFAFILLPLLLLLLLRGAAVCQRRLHRARNMRHLRCCGGRRASFPLARDRGKRVK